MLLLSKTCSHGHCNYLPTECDTHQAGHARARGTGVLSHRIWSNLTESGPTHRFVSLNLVRWIAPSLKRSDPPYLADERRRLDSWLDFQRATLLSKADLIRELVDGVTGL